MMNNDKRVYGELKMLLDAILENEKGFDIASKYTSQSSLKIYFNRKSLDSNEFALELKSELAFLDFQEDKTHGISEYAQRTWFNFKWFFSRCDEEKILQKIIVAEQEIIEKYDNILKLTLRPSTRVLLTLQRECIENDLNNNKVFSFYCE